MSEKYEQFRLIEDRSAGSLLMGLLSAGIAGFFVGLVAGYLWRKAQGF